MTMDRSRAPFPAAPAAGLFGASRFGLRCASPAGATASSEIVAETPRLRLRRHAVRDFPDYSAMSGDPAMSRFVGCPPATPAEAWTRLLRHAGHWSLLGYGFLAIEEKASGRFVGETGLGDFRRELGPDFDEVPEGGSAIASWAQGRGYASEAAAAALEWFDSWLAPPRTVCLIHVDNDASIRVAAKLGYTPFGACTYRGYQAITFERLRPEGPR